MILFIITDAPQNARNETFWHQKFTLEEAAEDTCVVIHYRQITKDLVRRIEPWAICHSGGVAEFHEYGVLDDAVYRWLITEHEVPQIGFCGGHQIIAAMFGSTLGHMRPLREGEADAAAGYHAGLYKEWGIQQVRIVADDPLFDGLDGTIDVPEYHMDEVKELAPSLTLLASNDNCRVQAFRHATKPIYGTQFHPEQAPPEHPAGARIVRNFFRIARDIRSVS